MGYPHVRIRHVALSIGLLLGGTSAALAATPPAPAGQTTAATTTKPAITPQVKRMLAAMDSANTWGHPDLFGEYAGMKHYFKGDYPAALKYFKYGARYADKLSQLLIGLMYARGNGMAPDPSTACAWLQLAASRDYARFVQVRDAICAPLNKAQREQAKQTLAKLEPTYGDKTTSARLKAQMMVALRQRVGTHIGFDVPSGSMNGGIGSASHRSHACDGPSISYAGHIVPHDGCGNMWASWYRQPDQYLSVRESQWSAFVTVGSLQPVAPPDNGKPAQASATGTQKNHDPDASTDHKKP